MRIIHIISPLIAAASSLGALAVPAQPGLVERHLPDGTVVSVRIFGDEHGHYILSEDGWSLIEAGGTMWFAEQGADGSLRPSVYSLKARDSRTESWLATQPKEILAGIAAARSVSHAKRAPKRRNPGLHYTSFPHHGSPRAIVILAEFPDAKCSTKDAGDYFNRMLNEEGFKLWGSTGSARDYFIDSSSGKFKPDFDLYGPVTLPEPMAYYGGNDEAGDDLHPADLAVHACQLLDDKVDFRQYDHDGDGLIDNVFIFYAGRGEASGGSDDTVWPHSWDVRSAYYGTGKQFIFDGVELGHYACTNEWKGDRPDGIGTFVHEFSHVLGLPDLYVTAGGNAGFTPGSWDVMDYGPYSNLSRTPPAYSTYCRYAMEWIEPKVLEKADNLSLNPLSESNEACIIFSKDNPNEYFLFENRQQRGQDKYLPGHGMLVWHVDYDADLWEKGGVNNDPSHHHVDLVEADGLLSDATRADDAFPGSKNITSFTAGGRPAFKDWKGNGMPPVTEITEQRGVITFKFDGGLPDSETPVALPAADVESYSFTARWAPVADALAYRICVSASGAETPLIDRMVAPDSTSFAVRDVAPETTYSYTVAALQPGKGISPASLPVEVTTGEATFEWFAPVANEAAQTTGSAFTASWQPLDGATEYFVTLFNKTGILTEPDEQGFDGGADGLPADWKCSTTFKFDNANYAGKDVPSLRYSGSGGTLESAVYPTDIHSVSLWHRGLNNTAGNLITVEALVGDDWKPVGEVTVTENEGGRTDTVAGFPYGARAVRLAYVTVGSKKGALALDDVCVNREVSFTREIVAGIDRKSAGTSTSMLIEGLAPQTEYWYSVVATDGSLMSRESAPVRVITREAGYNAVETVDVSGKPARWFNLQGMELTVPPKREPVIEIKDGKSVKRIYR